MINIKWNGDGIRMVFKKDGSPPKIHVPPLTCKVVEFSLLKSETHDNPQTLL